MVLLVLGVLLIGAAFPVLWWVRRQRSRSALSWVTGIVGAAVLLVGAIAVGVYAWALTATDTSQLARALAWGDSAFGDQDRFPSRTIAASTDPVTFRLVDDSPVTKYAPDGSGGTFEQYLESADTTAFIVLHGDDLLYEGYFNGSSHDSIQTSFSVAKSFTATLVGIALEEGHIANLDDPVTVYVLELMAEPGVVVNERMVIFGRPTSNSRGHRPITALAAAYSAATCSLERCT